MRTSAAALELGFTEPSITAAKAVADTIAKNGSLQRDTLLWVMEQAYGGSSADGRWSLRDAYDMLELAEVMYLAKADLPADPGACVAALTELRITTEVIFFHRASRTAIFTDLIQHFEPGWFKGWRAIIAKLDFLTAIRPTVPRKFRMAFRDREGARRAVQRIMAWPTVAVLTAHGAPIRNGGQVAIAHAFDWLLREKAIPLSPEAGRTAPFSRNSRRVACSCE